MKYALPGTGNRDVTRQTRVLIVDDDFSFARQLKLMLEHRGYVVSATVSSGEEALQELREKSPDLVLMDVVLNGSMDGIEVAEAIRNHWDLPVVYLTGYADEEMLGRARVTSPLGYLVKPVERNELYAAIEMALYRHRMERRLRESEERYRAISEVTSDCIYTLRLSPDQPLEVLWATGESAHISGYSPEAFMEQGWEAIIHPEDHALVREMLGRHLAGESGSCELRVVTRDGDIRWVHNFIRPICERTEEGVIRLYGAFRDITRRKETEQAMRQSVFDYRTLFESAHDAVIIFEPEDERVLEVNRKACEIYGFEHDEFVGMSLKEIAQDVARGRAHVQAALDRGDEGYHFETVQYRRDGSPMVVEISAVSVDYQGQRAILSINRDITERKRAEKALRREHLRYRALFDQTNDAVFMIGLDGRHREVNRRAAEMLGYTSEELVGRSYMDFIVPEERAQSERREALLLDGHSLLVYERTFLRKDGHRVVGEINVVLVRDTSGQPLHFQSIVRDITERKRAEEALKESEKRYRLLFEEALTPVMMVDAVGKYVDANQAALDFLEISREELLERDVWSFTPPGKLDEMQREHMPFLEPRTLETDYYINGRVKTLLLNVAPVELSGRTLLYGIGLDITERKQVEEALERYMDELRRSNRELEQFSYVISHDLQEPLRMITSYLRLLEKYHGEKLDEEGREFVGFAVDGAVRMKAMIDALLSYSRVNTRGREPVITEVQDVLEQTLRDLAFMIAEHEAEVTYDSLPTVLADEAQLAQVFQNLITNALTFQRPSEEGPPRVHVSAEREGEMWHFFVQDNGIGIPEKDYERVFEVFQRLHTQEEYPGTGIGLAICKRVVKRHGGRIWVESEVGRGSTFHFTLPGVNVDRDVEEE